MRLPDIFQPQNLKTSKGIANGSFINFMRLNDNHKVDV